jgi:kynureninase
MAPKFEPAPGAEGWQLSTPSPLLYAAHRAALELFQKAGMEKIFAKGQNLNRYLWFLLEDLQIRFGQPLIRIITPKEESERGCQVSMLMTRNGKEVFDFLSQHGVFADWREPDVIRIAPVPLYNTFEEVWQFSRIMESAFKKYDQ